MPEFRRHVLVVGVSTRALAESAARAGYRVTAIDAFGDRDLRAVAEVVLPRRKAGRRYGPMQAAAGVEQVAAPLVAYTSNFENYPRAVEHLARCRTLLGNASDVLRRIRDPYQLQQALLQHGLPAPLLRTTAPPAGVGRPGWLLKPRRSGGGHGVRLWRLGLPVPRSMYLQERIPGIPGSFIFASSRSGSMLLGLTRQLIGETAFGARGYRYCGSLLAGGENRLFPSQTELLEHGRQVAAILTREFRLVGLNGADFIARDGIPYIIEVNPRFSASMELVERGSELSMFEVHASACRGALPALPALRRIQGKAIVFARRDCRVDSSTWPAHRWLADLPHHGEEIPKGRPICTVLADAATGTRCRQLLADRATTVYRATSLRLSRAS